MAELLENIDYTRVLKIVAAATAGLFAGGALYINVVQVPAMMTVKDTVSLRQDWKITYLRAAAFLPKFALVSCLSGLGVAYLSREEKWLYGSGAILIISVVPFTKFVMSEDIKILLQDDVIEERGVPYVRNSIAAWDKRHIFRTMFGLGAFDLFLYGLYKMQKAN